jgi:hypothetical protein
MWLPELTVMIEGQIGPPSGGSDGRGVGGATDAAAAEPGGGSDGPILDGEPVTTLSIRIA